MLLKLTWFPPWSSAQPPDSECHLSFLLPLIPAAATHLPRVIPRSGHLPETLVKGKVVSNGILGKQRSKLGLSIGYAPVFPKGTQKNIVPGPMQHLSLYCGREGCTESRGVRGENHRSQR